MIFDKLSDEELLELLDSVSDEVKRRNNLKKQDSSETNQSVEIQLRTLFEVLKKADV